MKSTKTKLFFILLIGCFYLLAPFGIMGQNTAALVKDIATPENSLLMSGRQFEVMEGITYFDGTNDQTGTELWRSDGTPAGTYMIKDINPGFGSSYPTELVAAGNLLFFVATNENADLELWKSDGTVAGTQLVKDVTSGSDQYIEVLYPFGFNTILFRAYNDDSGLELWRSDGTEAGTYLLKDIDPGIGSSFPTDFINFNGETYFSAKDEIHGNELWKTDGTNSGTVLVKDIYPGAEFSGAYNKVLLNGKIYFVADDGIAGRELWESDGTYDGTQLVKDIDPGAQGSVPQNLTIYKNKIYFAASDASNGREVWVSDGTTNGTNRLTDIGPGAADGILSTTYFVGNNNYLLFRAHSSTANEELWRTDGTTNGTQIVKDIAPGPTGSRPLLLFEINGKIIFTVNDYQTIGTQFWITDGTEAGTASFAEGFDKGIDFAKVGGKILFTVDDSGNTLLFESDGTLNGTKEFEYIPQEEFTGSFPTPLQVFGNDFLFFAKTNSTGYELWKTDGNANTQLVKETSVGITGTISRQGVSIGNNFYFLGTDNNGQDQIFASDGTEAGTQTISDNWFSTSTTFRLGGKLVTANDELYFDVFLDDNIRTIYKYTIGDNEPNLILANGIYEMVATSEKVYILKGTLIGTNPLSSDIAIAIIETDGTSNSAFDYLGIAGRFNPINGSMKVINDQFFHTRTNVSSHKLFYNGTLIYELITNFGPVPKHPIFSGNRLFFASPNNQNQPGLSEDLLQYENGTTTVIKSFPDGITPYSLTDVDGTVFFVAEEGSGNLELWKSDGTEAGTVLVKDILPGSESSHPENLLSHNGKLYFSANDGSGIAIWESDGTFGGTQKVGSFPNSAGANLENFIAVGDELFFSGNDGQIGQELWKMDLQVTQAAGPDAELSMSASVLNPPVYTNTTISLNLSNTGDSPLSGLTVDLPVPTGLAFVSQNVGTGTYSNWLGKWNIGTLAAGETATMDLTLFLLNLAPIDIFAEVATQNESENDSSPGNGNPPNPSEDDEAKVTLNGFSAPCNYDFIGLSVGNCNDNGTADPSDDYYTFAINPIGTNLGNTYDLAGQRPNGPNFFINDLPYGQPYLSGNQLISDGDIAIELQDGNGVCIETLTINAPASCGPASDPELAISFIQSGFISTFPADPFEIEIQMENNGTGGSASFKTAYYLSSDYTLDNNDPLLLQTSNVLDAGATEENMENITLDASTTPGQYYLIAKIDSENIYAEADENNNLDVRRIIVWDATQNDCEEFYQEVDEIVCSSKNGAGNYEIISRNGDNYSSTVIDENGNELSSGTPLSYEDDVVNVVDGKIEKKDRNGGIIYSIDIPPAVLNIYPYIVDADELIGGSTGYVLSAAIGNDPYSIFLDDNLNIISQTALQENFSGPVVATEDGGAMIGTYRSPGSSSQGTTLFSQAHKVSPSNELEYDFRLNTFIGDAKRLACGTNRISFKGSFYRAGAGSSTNDTHTFEIEDLGNSTYKLRSFRLSGFTSNTPVSQSYFYLSVYQNDGTTLKYSYYNQPAVPSVNLPEVLSYRLEKLDINDSPIYTKELEVADVQFARVHSIYELNNDQAFILGRKQNRIWYFQPECNGTPPPVTCNDNLLSNPGYESSTNFPSGWFDLGGTSITNDANTGDHALLISGSAAGGILQNLPGIAGETYTLRAQVKRTTASNASTGNYISLKFLSASWQPLETLVDIVPAGNDFAEYGRSFTAPAGTAYVEAKAFKGNGDFEMIVDDWCLVQEGGSPCDNDNVPPVSTSCPDDITVYTTGTSAIVNWTPPTFTDNCGIDNITGLPYQPGDAFPVGNYSLGLTAIDLSGNSTSCTFLVRVIQQSGSQADLTGAQLHVPTSANTGSLINFDFDLQNIDTGNALGNFNIKSYLSTDQTLSNDDIQDGIIPTGNLAGNTSIDNVAGALSVPSSLAPGNYYLLLAIDADQEISESNENNNLLVSSSTIAISQITTNGTDLELSASADISTIEAWQSFSLSLTLKNTGTSAATNVIVDFPKPDGAVFQGGNEYTASQGNYNSYDPQEWNVGTLGAGSTATITFNLFSTQGDHPLIAYSQVLSMDQNDTDSSPGNGTCCTANEDDEAALVIPTTTTTVQTRQGASVNQKNLALVKAYPNPAIDQIQLIVKSPLAKTTIVQVYNSLGQMVIANNIDLEKGINQLTMDISLLDAGMYFILLPEGHGKKNQLRFVKERN